MLTRYCCNVIVIVIITGILCNVNSLFEDSHTNVPLAVRLKRQAADCGPEEFACNSGQCIKKILLCDENQDCNDGSDETHEKCKPKSVTEHIASFTSGSCTLPDKPENGDFVLKGCTKNDSSPTCNKDSGTAVPNSTVLSYSCDTNYKIEGNEQITCFMSQWLSSANISCDPVCGVRHDGNIPWHVSVYRYMESGTVAILCNGVLISDSLVVSAAHCFWEYRTFWQFPKELFVALGERNMDFITKEYDAQIRELKEVKFPDNYHPKTSANDIVLLRLSAPVEITQTVSPICIDWDNIYERIQLVNENVGLVAVRVPTENRKPNQMFQESQLSFVDFEECQKSVQRRLYLTEDKFCANNSYNGDYTCYGTDGAGLAFQTNGLWYLRGILSKGLSQQFISTCRNQLIGLTHISHFLSFFKSL